MKNEQVKEQGGYIEAFIILAFLGITACVSSGCSSQTGWTVQFGVAPVKQIDNRQQTLQANERREEGAVKSRY